MKNKPHSEYIEGAISKVENIVKHGKPKKRFKKAKVEVLNKVCDDIPDLEREKICRKAREKAHNPVADVKREISNTTRDELEGFI